MPHPCDIRHDLAGRWPDSSVRAIGALRAATESPFDRVYLRPKRIFPLLVWRTGVRSGGARREPMSHDVYYQFITTSGQARRAGARGGKATVRNRRERLHSTSA